MCFITYHLIISMEGLMELKKESEMLRLFSRLWFTAWISSAVFHYQLSLGFQMGWWPISRKWNFTSESVTGLEETFLMLKHRARLYSSSASQHCHELGPVWLWSGAFSNFLFVFTKSPWMYKIWGTPGLLVEYKSSRESYDPILIFGFKILFVYFCWIVGKTSEGLRRW